jgi:uncharacterized protein YbjT (DUF2867 family)
MKKIIIIGASGSLAPYVTEALLATGNAEVTLFARNPKYIHRNLSEKCKIIQANATEYNAVKNAISGQDIVYVNLAGELETMTNNIVNAMQETGVRKIIAISSIGIYEKPLSSILKPYRALADIIEASGLDYTILRPDWFTNADEIDYTITYKGERETGKALSRKSIAAFIATVVENPALYSNINVGISKPN